MKNFVFPQIFQPVFGQTNTNLLAQWHVTSRRIQTQAELSSQKIKTRKIIKGPHNFLLEPTKLDKSGSHQLKQQSVENVSQPIESNQKYRVGNEKIKLQLWNNASAKIEKQNKKINNIRYSTSRKLNSSNHGQNSTRKLQISRLFKKDELNTQQVKNIQQSNIDLSSAGLKDKNKNSTKIKKFKGKKGLKVSFQSEQKTEVVKAKQSKVESQKSIKSERSQNSYGLKSKKNIPTSKEDLRGNSSKKLIHRQKRRFGIQNPNINEVDFEMTDDMSKVLDNNKRYNEQQEIMNNNQPEFIESECTIYQSKQSIPTIEKPFNIKKNKGQGLTCVLIEGEREVRKHKKSYTIWDVKSESDEQKQAVKEKAMSKQSTQGKQKNKKKVHFGRTSIEEKTEKNKVSCVYPSNSKMMKFKGVPKRSEQEEPVQSLIDFGEGNSWKVFINNKAEIKKGIKPKRAEINNVYNELNYFRMRLNVNKKQQEDFQASKPHPQAIIYSVEKVLHELENDRRERTKYSNMMIDFGVKLTKDHLLKQKPIREKVINIRA